MRFRALALLTSVFLGTWPATSGAVTNAAHAGHSIRIWQTEDGLPQNTVTAITQTADGYLWVGTLAGLARFDGERFQVFDGASTPVLGEARIEALCEDGQGTLWIGHDGGQISVYRQGRFENPGKPHRTRGKINALIRESSGAVLVLRQTGEVEPALAPPGLIVSPDARPDRMVKFAQGRGGPLWVAIDGKAFQETGGRLEPLDLGAARYTGFIRGLAASHDGGFWVVRDGRVRKWHQGRWTEDRGPWGASDISTMLELSDGTLAIGTMDSGYHLLFADGRTATFDHTHGLIQNWIRLLYEDREGNLWVGAGTNGLAAVRRTAFTVLNSPDNWQGRTVLSVASSRDGALWIGTEGAGIYRYAQESWTHFGEADGVTDLYIWSLATDDTGRVWAGTWGGDILRLEQNRFVPATGLDVGNDPVLALLFTPEDRTLWIGTGSGVHRASSGDAPSMRLDEPGAPASMVCSIARDARGTLWFALADGLARLDETGFRHFNRADGLPGNQLHSLLPDGDALWIGTRDGGLSRLKEGRFATIGPKQGLASKVICRLEDDGRGHLWISTHNGILRLSKDELNRCADGEIAAITGQVYDKNDGLPTLEYSGGLQAAGCRTLDGRLWFTSAKGLVSVDPAAVRINTQEPPVVIESLHVDNEPVELGSPAPANLQLPPDHQRLEFQYTALSLAASGKALFKYRLVGLDKDWIAAGTRRIAFYSQLAPGDYRFEVIACNNDRVWNNRGSILSFSVRPFYWQTWWFRASAIVLAFSVVGLGARHLTRRRMQRRVEELERERSIERERARIAQDIHDDIGSSLTRITMLSQSARPGAGETYGTTDVLARIHDTAIEVTHTLDEIVWAVNPQHDTLDSLACYLARFAQDRLGEANVGCRLDLPLHLPAWPLNSQTRHNLLLAFKEAINNVLKHANATEVNICLELTARGFLIRLQDNGRGFLPPSASSPAGGGGNGLGNLHRRLHQSGGRCEIYSTPGQGTALALIVDVPSVVRLHSAPSP